MSNANEDQAHQEDSLTRPAWLQATVGDVQAVDIDAPLTGCTHADSDEIYELYCKAAADFGADKFADGPTGRVYSMLAAVMQMHFKPRERNEPFGPLYTSKDRRTAIPSDFLAQIDALATAAQSTGNPVLKARLADVCWLLDRNRKELGFIALDAYVEIVTKMEGRELTHHLSEKDGALHDESVGLLRRALCIGHALGRDKPGTIAARDAVRRLRK